jgi:hypothetical protein
MLNALLQYIPLHIRKMGYSDYTIHKICIVPWGNVIMLIYNDPTKYNPHPCHPMQASARICSAPLLYRSSCIQRPSPPIQKCYIPNANPKMQFEHPTSFHLRIPNSRLPSRRWRSPPPVLIPARAITTSTPPTVTSTAIRAAHVRIRRRRYGVPLIWTVPG